MFTLSKIKTIMAALVVVTFQIGDVQVALDKEIDTKAVVNFQQNNDNNQFTIQIKGTQGETVSSSNQMQKTDVHESSSQNQVTQEVNHKPSQGVTTFDVLDYFISKHLDKGLDGEHSQNTTDLINGHPLSQKVIGNNVYLVKWFFGVFETYRWDDDYLYLIEDHSVSGDKLSYQFTDGKWMKRKMGLGEKISSDGNQIKWFDANCNLKESKQFPIEMTLEGHDPFYNVGGDLGTQDVLVLKYDSSVGLPVGFYERYYFSNQWGLIRWEEYSKANNTLTNRRTFNKIIQPINPDISRSCI